MLAGYRREHAALADEVDRIQRRDLPEGWDRSLPTFEPDAKGLGGRDASAKVLNAVARAVPWLVGGSADLAPSTKTRLTFDGAGDLAFLQLECGIRELFDETTLEREVIEVTAGAQP